MSIFAYLTLFGPMKTWVSCTIKTCSHDWWGAASRYNYLTFPIASMSLSSVSVVISPSSHNRKWRSPSFFHMQPVNSSRTIHYYCSFRSVHAANFLVMDGPTMNWSSIASECTLHSLFFIDTHIFCYTCVHYIEVFFDDGTRNSVHCSELGGVH